MNYFLSNVQVAKSFSGLSLKNEEIKRETGNSKTIVCLNKEKRKISERTTFVKKFCGIWTIFTIILIYLPLHEEPIHQRWWQRHQQIFIKNMQP